MRRDIYRPLNHDGSAIVSTYLGFLAFTLPSGGSMMLGAPFVASPVIPDIDRKLDRTLFGFVWATTTQTVNVSKVSISGNSDRTRIYKAQQASTYFSAFAVQVPSMLSKSNIDFGITFDGNFTNNPRMAIWSITGLQEPFPIDAQQSATATDTTRSVDLLTRSGGLIIAAVANKVTAAQSCTWSGDQTPSEDFDTTAFVGFSAARTTSTNADPANTVTATNAVISTTGISLFAASFR